VEVDPNTETDLRFDDLRVYLAERGSSLCTRHRVRGEPWPPALAREVGGAEEDREAEAQFGEHWPRVDDFWRAVDAGARSPGTR
jgi:hypothetical protein